MDSTTTLYNKLKAAEPFFLLASPNLIESEEHIMRMAKSIKTIASKYAPFYLDLQILEKVKLAYYIPIVTEVHESIQTDLLVATAKTGKIINIKKGQFCAPSVMVNSAEKVRLAGNPNVMVYEREQCLDTSDVVDPKNTHNFGHREPEPCLKGTSQSMHSLLYPLNNPDNITPLTKDNYVILSSKLKINTVRFGQRNLSFLFEYRVSRSLMLFSFVIGVSSKFL
ncbi:hypothetical protein UlMin_024671 [Ulmus minor]